MFISPSASFFLNERPHVYWRATGGGGGGPYTVSSSNSMPDPHWAPVMDDDEEVGPLMPGGGAELQIMSSRYTYNPGRTNLMSAASDYAAYQDAVAAQNSRIFVPEPPSDPWGGRMAQLFRLDPCRDPDASLQVIASYLRPDDVFVDVGGGSRQGLSVRRRIRHRRRRNSRPAGAPADV